MARIRGRVTNTRQRPLEGVLLTFVGSKVKTEMN